MTTLVKVNLPEQDFTRAQCSKCGQVAYGRRKSPFVCAGCVVEIEIEPDDVSSFNINLGPMDWRLFQIQRATLLALTEGDDDRLSDAEVEHLEGILHLTDHIIDEAKADGIEIPALDDIVLDRLAELGS